MAKCVEIMLHVSLLKPANISLSQIYESVQMLSIIRLLYVEGFIIKFLNEIALVQIINISAQKFESLCKTWTM